MLFEVRQIVRRFGRRTALDGVSFDVAPGEVVGVLGANGAGKTTLMRVLAAYLQPESGDVMFDGRSVFADKVGYYGVLGYLPERCPLYDEMRVGDYLSFRGRLRGLGRRRTARRVKDDGGVWSERGGPAAGWSVVGRLAATGWAGRCDHRAAQSVAAG